MTSGSPVFSQRSGPRWTISDESMTDLAEINRQRVARAAFHPDHEDRLLRLNEVVLASIGGSHPYTLTANDLRRLRRIESWTQANSIGPASFQERALYRLGSIDAVGRAFAWHSFDVGAMLTTEELLEAVDSLPATDGWIALSEHAEGQLPPFRGRLWWTTAPIDVSAIAKSAYSLGIVNDFIPEYAVLLRLTLSGGEVCEIPSCVDGYHSPVFRIIEHRSIAGTGLTLDLLRLLDDPGGLEEAGCAEVVTTGAVGVSNLEMQVIRTPVRQIDPRMYLDDSDFLAQLAEHTGGNERKRDVAR